jgi:DnaJ domain
MIWDRIATRCEHVARFTSSSLGDTRDLSLLLDKTMIKNLGMPRYRSRFFSDREQHRGSHDDARRTGGRRSRSSPRDGRGNDEHYEVLGIPRNSSPETVKRAFLQLALRHHPDVSTGKGRGDGIAENSADQFVKVRHAFERIQAASATRRKADGGNNDETLSSSWFTEEEFDAWFYDETGQRMDASMRREVMQVYRSGLTRTEYGAVWEIAFVLEDEGFFTIKKESTLPKDAATAPNSDENDTATGKCKNAAWRRKRSF